MSDATTNSTPEKPKSSIIKKIFYGIGIIFAFLAIDHYTFNVASGGAEITVTDSTIVIKPTVNAPVVADTTKVDTTKK